MSSWVAGTPSFRDKLVKIADDTEINSIIIDIKDYTGKIAFEVKDLELMKLGSAEKRIPDIEQFIDYLHSKNIYIIGRVAVFQDPFLIKLKPELAVKKASNKNVAWKDRKGIGWLDAGAEEVWNYAIQIAKYSYELGFDEINFDYIRFPSDGDMKDIYYPKSEGMVKAEVIKSFFEYLDKNLRVAAPGIVTSADIFGMTTTNTDDLNIGQILEYTLPNFDYVAPMVYPSHFPATWNGLKNPAANPYEVIHYSMGKATERAKTASQDIKKLRPWLQDFDLGATYTKEMVRGQIKAVYDVGLTSWMLWDPGNTYTVAALESELTQNTAGGVQALAD
jgi:hypothetical protein